MNESFRSASKWICWKGVGKNNEDKRLQVIEDQKQKREVFVPVSRGFLFFLLDIFDWVFEVQKESESERTPVNIQAASHRSCVDL